MRRNEGDGRDRAERETHATEERVEDEAVVPGGEGGGERVAVREGDAAIVDRLDRLDLLDLGGLRAKSSKSIPSIKSSGVAPGCRNEIDPLDLREVDADAAEGGGDGGEEARAEGALEGGAVD